MANNKPIRLFWWDERKFLHKTKENYGDMLGPYLVNAISGRTVKFVHPKKQSWFRRDKKHYVTIGSILAQVTKDSVVWGSGIIDREHVVAEADFKAVRGPETRKYLLKLGYRCPEVYGDPALLLPKFFNPKIEKKIELGIIPHYKDFNLLSELYGDTKGIRIINMMSLDVEKTTIEILECRKVISSSLHGVIVAHAYQIPALWVKFSNEPFGDDIKFKDYYSSIGMEEYESPNFGNHMTYMHLEDLFHNYSSIPDYRIIEFIQINLLDNCPFN